MREKTVKLHDDEIAAKINLRTGELIEMPEHKDNKIHTWLPNAKFVKHYKTFDSTVSELMSRGVWKPLHSQIVLRMMARCKPNTNSLEPLSEKMSMRELGREFGLNYESVPKVLYELFSMGIYGKWDVADMDLYFKQFWVLNPYVATWGHGLHDDTKTKFDNTPWTLLSKGSITIDEFIKHYKVVQKDFKKVFKKEIRQAKEEAEDDAEGNLL